ncbi:LysR family transcriptional regulator [Thalassolituus sp.]|jgi:DNA-binding transcriptional LysR family regulator|uniref:LysR family transcriptional regulator n=1 Tax=Thalassolituus sp. TaxID=2030822 RepID=UPI002A81384A|nr:LysR family transcriptional regulator [Thalassolituus sp.]|tara:strand:- start:17 stop:922 length:906 start_codon:yes stop_codon:yes gene_type:complete
MQNINISRVDLNLFVVFDAIYREGNLTRASEQLNLSQPAVSHALARLRERFNDPLFERSGKGMAPTPLAKAIVGRVRAALQDLESTLTEGLAFDPGLASRIFTMASRDVMEAAALPHLMQRLQASAPQVQLRSIRVARRDMENALASGQIDFAADVLLPVSDQIRHQALGSETLVVIMRRGHPLASKPLDLDEYVNSRHILVSSRTEGQGVEDFALTRLGKVRQVTLRCQNYYAAVQVVANTDLLLTLPRTYAEQMQVQTGHIIQPLPLPLEPLEIQLYWHVKSTRDPAVMWLKEQMVDLF